ncbi:TPA: hypothetical protein DDW35_05075 [Candidatus Sumerlaeota bacterium]|jgi:hypothetical protein|nr:hypothetical protein [Candidatus Sumerlaeota bacterium]
MRSLCLILFLMTFAAYAAESEPSKKKDAPTTDTSVGESLVIQILDADNYNGLVLENNTKATTATLNRKTQIITLYDVKSNMLKDTTITATLTAPLGELFMTDHPERDPKMMKSDMLLSGNVHILRPLDGSTMDAPALRYDNAQEKIFSVGGPVLKKFKLQKSLMHCTSDSFVANKAMTEFEDTGNVHVVSHPADDTTTTSTLDAAKP